MDSTKKINEPRIEKKSKQTLTKFTLLRCLEEYFSEDHDQALMLTKFIWKRKDTIWINQKISSQQNN